MSSRRQIEWLERCREQGVPVYGQGVTSDAGFTFTLEDWNLYDDSEAWMEAWMEACMGSKEERLAKMSDPSRRQALKDTLPRTATAGVVVYDPDNLTVGPHETAHDLPARKPRHTTGRHRESDGENRLPAG
ncbi:hypothetical protein [Candidatus Poriferisodalis sp.]|uniref:hypothetical protein n=1 Tax=Candidatus Poriferisodalis sp. TaxID=3101277 RepID=UPI003B011C0D